MIVDVDGIGARAQDIQSGLGQRPGYIQRGLSAELHYSSYRLFDVYYTKHVFYGERFKIELIGGIVIGGYGLGVAVNHDAFIPLFFQRERGMATAIVELYALPYPVGAPTQY